MQLPTGWNQVTIAQYQELVRIAEQSSYTDIERDLHTLCVLTGKDPEAFDSMSAVVFYQLVGKLAFMGTLPKQEGVVPASIRIGGRYFRPIIDVRKMKAEDFIDVSAWSKDNSKLVDNLHNIVSRFMREEPSIFSWRRVLNNEERAVIFQHYMPVSNAYQIALFFCLHYKNLLAAMLDSSINQAKQALMDTMPIGAGS